MKQKIVDTLRELYFCKKTILEIIDALVNMKIKDRNIKLVTKLDTG